MSTNNLVFLTIPGYLSSGPTHWQSLWEKDDARFKRVNQKDWNYPNRTEWVHALNLEIKAHSDKKIILVAHSLGCLTVAHWVAKHCPVTEEVETPVVGAMLVAPCDPDDEVYPKNAVGFAPVPLEPFPFPSLIVGSGNDPYASTQAVHSFARGWGGQFLNIGNAGHINVESGFGPWVEGRDMFFNFVKGVSQ